MFDIYVLPKTHITGIDRDLLLDNALYSQPSFALCSKNFSQIQLQSPPGNLEGLLNCIVFRDHIALCIICKRLPCDT